MTSVWLRNALGQSSVSCGHVGEVPPGLCISSSPASSHPTTAAQASPGAQDHPTFILSITTPPPPRFLAGSSQLRVPTQRRAEG